MAWTDGWVGLRYAARARGPDAYDCLGLFLALQRERCGRLIADPGFTQASALRQDAAGLMASQMSRVEIAAEGDAVLFRILGRGLHVGFALGARTMLHVEDDDLGSMIADFTDARWRDQMQGIYRFHD